MSKLLDRRSVLNTLGAAIVGTSISAFTMRRARATPEAAQAAIRKIIGDKVPEIGKVHLDISNVVENGASILAGVSVESPMTEKDYVKSVHLFTEANPSPEVVSFHFTPRSGKADVVTRIRLAKSQNVIAIAEMNDGAVYMHKKYVRVTIGGCGGGN